MSQSCLEVLSKLYPYVDGELSAEEADQIRLHFELCSPCAPALIYVRSFRNTLHRASSAQNAAPRELHHRVNQLLKSELDR